METIGHHTCKKDNGKEYILKHAPFFADFDTHSRQKQFLGSGYYFWDDNIEMAHKWGKSHYKNNYFILQCNIHTLQDRFLDLVGNRSHMRYFREVAEKYIQRGYARKDWSLGSFIEHLKLLAKDHPEIFPFKIIRAVDLLPRDEKDRWYFVADMPNYTMLNPRIVICITSEKELFLQSKEIIFES